MELTGARWRKSSRSSGNGGACVEVADNLPGVVAVRDSKDPSGPTLTFTPTAWRAFVTDRAARLRRTRALAELASRGQAGDFDGLIDEAATSIR